MDESRPASLIGAARPLVAIAVLLAWGRAGAAVGLVLWAMSQLDDPANLGWGDAVLAAGLLAVRVLAGVATPTVAATAATRVDVDLRERVFRQVLALGPRVERDRRTGELVSRATEGVEAVGTYAGVFLPMLIQGITVPLLIIGVIAFIDLPTALALLVAVPLIPGLLRFLEKRFQSVSERYRENADRLAGRFLDSIQGLTTLRAFGRARSHGEELAEESEQLRSATMRLLFINQLALLAVDSLFSLGTVVLATVVLVARAQAGIPFNGETVGIVLLAALLIEALSQIGRFFYVGAIGRASARSMREFLSLPADEPPRPVGAIGQGDGSIELHEVGFAYPDGPVVLEDVTIRIAPGETVALVGPSGAGKTTIARLMLGFLTPRTGRVRVAGRDLEEAGAGWARANVSLVSQSPYLFRGTIADNLRLARADASPAELEEAARAAHLLEVVERLPQGWDTEVGERGLELSGGEAQRVAIARALLRDTPIVVLDEPTSNVDLESERAIRDGIARLAANRTLVVIAHRYSTVAGADRVVVLEEGRVRQEGTPDQLATGEGLFARMARAQAGGPA